MVCFCIFLARSPRKDLLDSLWHNNWDGAGNTAPVCRSDTCKTVNSMLLINTGAGKHSFHCLFIVVLASFKQTIAKLYLFLIVYRSQYKAFENIINFNES